MNTPVIFIHGLIGTLDVIDFDYTHASPDLLGYGADSTAPSHSISLNAQVENVRVFIDRHFDGRSVHVVGHSVGGAIAMLLAHAHPEYVRKIVNVEGNFTLEDAFWSASVGRMTSAEADAMLKGFREDPVAWLSGAVVKPTEKMYETAVRWLGYQPASTLRAMGKSIVATTGNIDYLAAVKSVFERHAVYLIAGERSRGDWNVPEWALEKCADYQTIRQCGHLMMLEDPEAFSATVKQCLFMSNS